MARRVLITGVARHLGGRLAQILAASPDVEVVVGVDTTVPKTDLGRTEFVRADIRNPIIAKVLSTERIDTVVHMNLIATPERGRRAYRDERDQRHRGRCSFWPPARRLPMWSG